MLSVADPKVCLSRMVKEIPNRVGARTQPCFTLLLHWTQGLLDAITHLLDISRVCCKLDLGAEPEPKVIIWRIIWHSSGPCCEQNGGPAGYVRIGFPILLNDRHYFFRVSLEPVC